VLNEILNATSFKFFIAGVCASLVAWFGGWDTLLKFLVFLVVFDYITGIIAAWVEKKVSSNIGARGIAKKICLFIPIGIAFWLDQLFGSDSVLRSMAIGFYIGNEGISLTENLTRIGVPMPPFITESLQQVGKLLHLKNPMDKDS
jgi:toxin secretion/phage lysis holin